MKKRKQIKCVETQGREEWGEAPYSENWGGANQRTETGKARDMRWGSKTLSLLVSIVEFQSQNKQTAQKHGKVEREMKCL